MSWRKEIKSSVSTEYQHPCVTRGGRTACAERRKNTTGGGARGRWGEREEGVTVVRNGRG